jgi:ATP-dependent DNA helicase RecQ
MIMSPQDALKKHFGLETFRYPQEEIIQAILNKQDTMVIMPTGGGKSLCFQLPALLLPGVTLVISPLIALMKDQVDALQAKGIAAAMINSSQSWPQQQEILRSLQEGKQQLLYIAPERFRARSFTDSLKGIDISLVAVDVSLNGGMIFARITCVWVKRWNGLDIPCVPPLPLQRLQRYRRIYA